MEDDVGNVDCLHLGEFCAYGFGYLHQLFDVGVDTRNWISR